MAVVYESQIHASCDNARCNSYEITSTMGMREFKKYLRDMGWKITRDRCICPVCINKQIDREV